MKTLLLTVGFSLASAAYGASLQPADAAQAQDRESLRALVRQHANLNLPQPDGTTALQWAAHWNDLEAVKLLLGPGANGLAAHRDVAPPLSEAVVQGSAPMMDVVRKAGAAPNTAATGDGETVLMSAARAGT